MRFSVTIDAAGLKRGLRDRVRRSARRLAKSGRKHRLDGLPSTSNLGRDHAVAELLADPWNGDEMGSQDSDFSRTGDNAKT